MGSSRGKFSTPGKSLAGSAVNETQAERATPPRVLGHGGKEE